MANYNKYQKLMLFERVKGTSTWYPSVSPEGEPTYKKGEIIEVDSPDCGAPAEPIYRWYVIPNSYMCDEELHIKYQEKVYQVSTDGGLTWKEVEGVEHERGEIIERDSVDCGAIVIVYQWVNVAGEYLCNGTDKYYVQKQQISYNNGRTWEDVVPEQRRRGDIMETQASDCGYEGDWIESGFQCERVDGPTPPEPEETRWIEVGNRYCDGTSLVVLMKQQHKVNGYWVDYNPEVTKIEVIQLESDECIVPPGPTKTNCFTYEPINAYENEIIAVFDTACEGNGTGRCCVPEINHMSFGFNRKNKLTALDLSELDTSNVTNMKFMFRDCSSLTNLDLSGWDTSNVTDMEYMFSGCSSLPNLDLSGWDTSNVTSMFAMFIDCSSLTNLDLSHFDTRNVRDMNGMFYYCSSLTNLDLSGWNTSNVEDVGHMFEYCESLTNLNLSGWDTSNVTDMSGMFAYCKSLTNLDLSGWDTSNVTDMDSVFYGCNSLTTIYARGCNSTTITRLNNLKPSKTVIITD